MIINHHQRKSGTHSGTSGEEIRGSSDILAFLDCHLSIHHDKKKKLIKVTQTKQREQEERKPFYVKYTDVDKKIIFEFSGDVKDEEFIGKVKQVKDFIVECLAKNTEIHRSEIVKKIKDEKNLEIGESTLKSATKELLEENIISQTKAGGNNSVFKLKG